LQHQPQKTVMTCLIRGKKGGTLALYHGRKSYRTTCTFTDGTITDVAVVTTLPPGKDGKRCHK
jgi:hypothetical protein